MRLPSALHILIIVASVGAYAVSACLQPSNGAAATSLRSLWPQPHARTTDARQAVTFDPDRALETVEDICAIGEHAAASQGERLVGDYLIRRLRRYGYRVAIQDAIPVGRGAARTRNLCVRLPGRHEGPRLVIGAHYDSLRGRGNLGANDNASGVAVVLELARILSGQTLTQPVQLVFFGAEERMWPGGGVLGSADFVANSHRSEISGMISVDMVGRGDVLYAWYAGGRPDALLSPLRRSARQLAVPLTLRAGEPRSDHHPFLKAGIPAVWLQRLPDPDNHKSTDIPANLSLDALAQAGRLLQQTILPFPPI